MTQGLLIVDLQNDYFDGGALPLSGINEAADKAHELLTMFRDKGQPVFHIQHLSVRPGATFFVPDTDGAKIHPSVQPLEGESVTQKNFPNSFRDTDLLNTLKHSGVDELVICGAMSHMCIDATTRAAFDYGFSCTVIADACATRDLEFNGEKIPAAQVHAAFMAALAVPYADVVLTADLLTVA